MADHTTGNNLYRALWRWHFYAGLIALPFMLLLSITGAIYLFKDEINNNFFGYRNIVPAYTSVLLPSALIAKAEAALPGSKVLTFTSNSSDISSINVIANDNGVKKIVWLNPANGNVLDIVPRDNEFNTVVKHLHSLDYFGDFANRVIEIIGGFALVLVVTGIYLWWPRGQSGGIITLRGTPQKRVFWRDLHAVTGAIAGALIFFLALTGMPWSGFWGDNVHAIADAQGWGYPKGMWDNVPNSDMHANHMMDKTGWTVATSPMPNSRPAMSHKAVGIDRAYDIALKSNIARGFQLSLPADEEGVYTASVFPDDLERQRLIHIDQYSGATLVDVGYKDYGATAKTIEFGINTHMGQQFGWPNQLAMLVTCLAIIISSVTAAVMWWKRRPQGRLGVPPHPADKRVYTILWLIMLGFGALFPLTGLAIILMLAFDLLLVRNIPVLRRAFS